MSKTPFGLQVLESGIWYFHTAANSLANKIGMVGWSELFTIGSVKWPEKPSNRALSG